MFPAVFVSHSSEDRARVSEIVRKLEDHYGVKVWVSYRDMPTGEWDRSIEQALNSASHVLVIVSQHSIDSTYVRAEVEYALHNNKTVIPILIEEIKLPLRWYTLQYFDFTDDENSKVYKLSNQLPKAYEVELRNNLEAAKNAPNLETVFNFMVEPHWLIFYFIDGDCILAVKKPSLDKIHILMETGSSFINALDLIYFCSPETAPINEKGDLTHEAQNLLQIIPTHIADIKRYSPHDYERGMYDGGPGFLRGVYLIGGKTEHYSEKILQHRYELMSNWKERSLRVISYTYLFDLIQKKSK